MERECKHLNKTWPDLKEVAQSKVRWRVGIVDKYYGDSEPSISIVKKWFTDFRCGRTSTIDAERSGRPVEVAIPERLKVRKIVEAIGISHGSVVSILKDHLGMKIYPQDGCRDCSQSTINAIV